MYIILGGRLLISVEKFNQNIKVARDLFLEVFKDNDSRVSFLEKSLKDDNYLDKVEDSDKTKINKAVDLLIENARVEERRKMQQAHFGPLIGKMRVLEAKEIAQLLKNDEEIFIDFLQLLIIFLFRKDIESENHSHDAIREVLYKKCNEILKEIKG